jgi:hypothetical protein
VKQANRGPWTSFARSYATRTLVDVDLPTEVTPDETFSGSALADGTLFGTVRLLHSGEPLEFFDL